MIEIKNLSVDIDNIKILKNIDLNIQKGEFVSFVGQNGSGKTTLIRTISMLLNKYKGDILYSGTNIREIKRKEFSRIVSVYTPLKSSVSDFSVEEFVSFGREPYRKWFEFSLFMNVQKDLIDAALEKAGCLHLSKRKLSTLSSGEFQKVNLALIMAQNSEVIVLDEPITHLDINAQHDFLEILDDLNKNFGKTIISVFHEINYAVKYSNRIIALKRGEVVFEGKPEKLINEKNLLEIYDAKCNILNDTASGKRYVIP